MHWKALKWMLIYLSGTKATGLSYSSEFDPSKVIEGYVESQYAGFLNSRRSLSGYIFTAHGGDVSWKPNLQKVVAMSTIEVEYMAAIKEGI